MHVFIQIANHMNNDPVIIRNLFRRNNHYYWVYIHHNSSTGGWISHGKDTLVCVPESVCVNVEAVGWEEAEGTWKGIWNGEHTHSQASKVMKRQMLPMDPVGMLFPATPNATGSCWTEIKFGATCKGPLAMKDVCVLRAFYFDLPIDQKLAVPRKLFYLVFLLTWSP